MKKKIVFGTIIASAIGGALVLYNKNQRKIVRDSNEKVLKFKMYYQLCNQWIKNKIEHLSLEKALLDRGYQSISIYGNGELGCRLYEELRGSDVKVTCFIDKKANDITLNSEDNILVYGIDEVDSYSKVDAIIVSTVNIFEDINNQLSERNVGCDIVSLEDVIFNMTN